MGMTIDNLCNSCTNSGCVFQSGIVRTKCAFYMPPTVRLIDADLLREEVNSWGMNDYEPSDFTDAIDDAPTVEAIPKDQYEARLKADMVAILEDLDLQIEESAAYNFEVAKVQRLIREKINALKENKDGFFIPNDCYT